VVDFVFFNKKYLEIKICNAICGDLFCVTRYIQSVVGWELVIKLLLGRTTFISIKIHFLGGFSFKTLKNDNILYDKN
jgi:hypothetical protein